MQIDRLEIDFRTGSVTIHSRTPWSIFQRLLHSNSLPTDFAGLQYGKRFRELITSGIVQQVYVDGMTVQMVVEKSPFARQKLLMAIDHLTAT